MIGGKLEYLTENRTDAGLVGGERRREVGDDEDGRSSISDPCVTQEVREEIDGGMRESGGGCYHVGSEETERKVIDDVHV